MSSRNEPTTIDPATLARQLSSTERDLSRQARERLETGGGADGWFALVEVAVVQLRRVARELGHLDLSAKDGARAAGEPDFPEPDPTVRTENVLSGHASVVSVSEVLGFLSAMGKNGVLWVDLPKESFLVQLKDGAVVYAQGDNPPDGQRLGEILVRQKSIDAEEMSLSLREAANTHEVLGTHLVRSGRITPADLSRALAEQAQMIFHRMFGSPDASYRFEDGVSMVESQDVRLNVIQLLLESARANDEETMHLKAGLPVSLARCD